MKSVGKIKVSSLRSRQRARATQGGSQPVMRNCAGIPPKTLEFLMFPGGPRRGNDVNPGLPFVIHRKTYGFLKSFKILGKTRFPACRTGSTQWRPKEAPSPRCKTALGSYPKTLEFLMFPACPRRLLICVTRRPEKTHNKLLPWILGKPDRYPSYMPFVFLCISFVFPLNFLCIAFVFPQNALRN